MTETVQNETPLPLRNDTILGVCEALGQDLGVNPTWFRLAFIAPLFFQPILTIAAYLGIGLVIAASRKIYPRIVQAAPQVDTATTAPANRDEDYQIAA